MKLASNQCIGWKFFDGDRLSPILRFALRNSLLTELIAERLLVVYILYGAMSY